MAKPSAMSSRNDFQAERKVAALLNQTRVRVSKLSRHYDKIRTATVRPLATPHRRKRI